MAISPPRSGKTLAYLCPLITSLTDQRLYKEIATGNGVRLAEQYLKITYLDFMMYESDQLCEWGSMNQGECCPDSRPSYFKSRGPGFNPHYGHRVVSLSNKLHSVLVDTRKTWLHLYMT